MEYGKIKYDFKKYINLYMCECGSNARYMKVFN